MIPDSKDRATPLHPFIVSHARQEQICKQVYDYLTRAKLAKLKEAVRQLNRVIRQMLRS